MPPFCLLTCNVDTSKSSQLSLSRAVQQDNIVYLLRDKILWRNSFCSIPVHEEKSYRFFKNDRINDVFNFTDNCYTKRTFRLLNYTASP